jgi:hypothetical protein
VGNRSPTWISAGRFFRFDGASYVFDWKLPLERAIFWLEIRMPDGRDWRATVTTR